MLTGIGAHVRDQLEKTDLLELIGEENIFPAEPVFTAALEKAIDAASRWLDEGSEEPAGEE